MYTIRFISMDGNSHPHFPAIAKTFEKRIAEEFSKFNVETKGVHPFLGRKDYYTLHGFIKKGGSELEFEDWLQVNQSINNVLDQMKVVAFVRAPKYTVRSSKQGV